MIEVADERRSDLGVDGDDIAIILAAALIAMTRILDWLKARRTDLGESRERDQLVELLREERSSKDELINRFLRVIESGATGANRDLILAARKAWEDSGQVARPSE